MIVSENYQHSHDLTFSHESGCIYKFDAIHTRDTNSDSKMYFDTSEIGLFSHESGRISTFPISLFYVGNTVEKKTDELGNQQP